MRMFWEVTKLAFQQQMTYRAANLAGLATNFFFGLLRAAVLVALYGTRAEVSGLSRAAAVTYTGLTQAIIAYLSFFSWWSVMQSVYSGDIGSDMLKPMPYLTFWLAQDMGRAIASFLMRSVTIMVAYALMFDVVVPRTVAHWLGLVLSLILSEVVSFGWRFLVNLAAFWTPDARGIGRMAFGLSWFMSGFLMPLRFFPDWFIKLCQCTPFPSMVTTPVEVYLGVLNGSALITTLLLQVFWAVLLLLVCQLVLRAGVRKLVIQGG